VNRLGSEAWVGRAGDLGAEARERLLSQRIERAKERLVGDVSRFGAIARGAEARAIRGVVVMAIALGALVALRLAARAVERRRRRLDVRWR
jgi:hypothetical protein